MAIYALAAISLVIIVVSFHEARKPENKEDLFENDY
jgi:hypothetical protein